MPQARIVALNAHQFLKAGGGFLISIKASCVDSTATPEAVYAMEAPGGPWSAKPHTDFFAVMRSAVRIQGTAAKKRNKDYLSYFPGHAHVVVFGVLEAVLDVCGGG